MARTTGKETASKLTGNFRGVPSLLSARNFHALNNSHFCERAVSCGNVFLNVVYWVRSRMLCRDTFAAEGHAKSNSHRVDIPKLSPLSRLPILGKHPKGELPDFGSKLAVMKKPRFIVQRMMDRGEIFLARTFAGVCGPNLGRDAARANQQQQFAAAWACELSGPICVQLSVRYNQS